MAHDSVEHINTPRGHEQSHPVTERTGSYKSSHSLDSLNEPSAPPSWVLGQSEQPSERQPSLRTYYPIFTILIIIVWLVLLVFEFRENAKDEDFEETATQECYFRIDIRGAQFCAAAFEENPLFGPDWKTLVRMGGLRGYWIIHNDEYWRLFTSIFLQGGAIHLGVNVLSMVSLAVELERYHGFLRIGSIFIQCALFGALATAVFEPHTLSIGASGGVVGLLGAAMTNVFLNWDCHPRPCLSLVLLVWGLLIQLFMGTMPLMNNYVHIFGFGIGIVSSLLLLARLNERSSCLYRCSLWTVRVVAGLIILVSFALAVAILFPGALDIDTENMCPECHQVNCKAFPWGCEDDECWWTCDGRNAP